MSEKIFSNPNIDLYDIDFDLNNRWEQIDTDAIEGKFDIKEFYNLCYDTHRLIEKYDKCERIPRASLVLSDLLYMFFCDDWVLDSRRDFFLCTNHAGNLREMLIYGLEQDVETDEDTINFDTEYNLIPRWESLCEDFHSTDKLDVERFREVAADTYKLIKKYQDIKMIHRSTPLLLRIIGLGYYNDAVSFVADEISRALAEALEDGLTEKTDENGEPVLVVHSVHGDFEVNANTFDFSETVKSVPDWTKYSKKYKE